MCVHISIFGNIFLTVKKFQVVKKMKVAQEGPIYTIIFSLLLACAHAGQPESWRDPSMLELISQATYIRSEIFQKQALLYGKGKPNAVGDEPKANQAPLSPAS